ncbi:MAG: 50S ribosomal protein L2 [Candidatus Woesearchaeota archaeon]|nr:50S ribosomal protein L2 [Candidatus Woesearchaeota archaeon]
MGKNLISQKRGKGSGRYRAPSFRYAGECAYGEREPTTCMIIELLHSQGHSAPLLRVRYADGKEALIVAPEGVRVGDMLSVNSEEARTGNTMLLEKILAGTIICNLELIPGDGGKLIRAAGAYGKVLSKIGNKILVQMPSKEEKIFNGKCMAMIGNVAAAGKVSKPWLKAGIRYFAMHARNKRYPRIHGISMNAVNHPFGGSSSHHKGKPTIAPKNAPPGRKVGKIRPSRTGRRKKN